jgi:DNA-binding MarR family transcriptional regulator
MTEIHAGRRRRSAVLEILERFRRLHADLNDSAILAFLYICENEGLNICELAQICRIAEATASRVARRLAARYTPDALHPGVGLVELRANPFDQRGKLLFLTPAGIEFRDSIDALIAEAVPIVPAEVRARKAGAVA